jgi:Protein of unknown function (DUF742)
MPAGDKWVDRNAGPVVRPYALTGGRTEPASGAVLDVITVIVATTWAQQPDDWLDLPPEHRRILGLCRRPVTVADVASTTALPLGVVRVLLADLIMQGRITARAGRPVGEEPSAALLKEVLHGLRAL